MVSAGSGSWENDGCVKEEEDDDDDVVVERFEQGLRISFKALKLVRRDMTWHEREEFDANLTMFVGTDECF